MFKSHLKVKTSGKLKKKILIKNIILFMFLTRFFLKNFQIGMFFRKRYKGVVNILKAPCRHKKFFHKLVYEYYTVSITYLYKERILFDGQVCASRLFAKLSRFYNKFGTTSLCRTKLLVVLPIRLSGFYNLV